MATIKSYSDLQQSKKLAEILPLESADMCYIKREINDTFIETPIVKPIGGVEKSLCCWSLAALINILPNGSNIVKEETDTENEKYMCTVGIKDDIISTFADNPVDACFEMILKLHGLNLL